MRSVALPALWVLVTTLGCTTWGDIGYDLPRPPPCQCVPYADDDWLGPELVWIGPEEEAPDCPAYAVDNPSTLRGHADLSAEHVCDCRCEPPTTAMCELPFTFFASAALCNDVTWSTKNTIFNAPAPWDGSCTPFNPIEMGQLCPPDGLCAQSLSIAPAVLTEPDCERATDSIPIVTQPPPTWATFAKGCHGTPLSEPCRSTGQICALTADGFLQCLHKSGVLECPEFWPEQHIFYDEYKDTRSCSPCSCGEPVGSTCTTEISVYSNSTCSGTPLLHVPQGAKQTECYNLWPPGPALKSKKATPPTYHPGTCEPIGGEPVGGVVALNPRTYCCLPPDYKEE